MTTLFLDTFTSDSTIALGSHSPETGGVWSSASFSGGAGINVVGGAGYATGTSSSSTSQWVNAADIPADDCEYQLVFSQSAQTPSRAGFLFRLTSASVNTAYQIFWLGDVGKQLILQRNVNNVVSQVGIWDLGSDLSAGAHAITAAVTGAEINVYMDGVLRITYIDSSPLTGTKIGILARSVDRLDQISVTTSGGGDTTPPTLTGSITVSAITSTSYTASWPAGADDTAVTGYEYSVAGGAWVDAGNVLTVDITGRTPGATETFEVRAYDASGNRSTPALSTSVTLNAATSTVTVTDPLKNNTGTLLASQSGITAAVLSASSLASVHEATGLTTNASGLLAAISNASITTGQSYHVAIKLADGSVGITGPITAS